MFRKLAEWTKIQPHDAIKSNEEKLHCHGMVSRIYCSMKTQQGTDIQCVNFSRGKEGKMLIIQAPESKSPTNKMVRSREPGGGGKGLPLSYTHPAMIQFQLWNHGFITKNFN